MEGGQYRLISHTREPAHHPQELGRAAEVLKRLRRWMCSSQHRAVAVEQVKHVPSLRLWWTLHHKPMARERFETTEEAGSSVGQN